MENERRIFNLFDGMMENHITLSNKVNAPQKVLWAGKLYMNKDQVATLSEPISKQKNGIVLLWSYYNNGEPVNSDFIRTFIPKHWVNLFPGKGHSNFCYSASLNIAASKYCYVNDTTITGFANNYEAAYTSTSGVKVSNRNYVLRYVIGV